MIANGVTRLKWRGRRLVLAGDIRRGAVLGAPGPVRLQLCGLPLAEAIPFHDADDEPNIWHFRFVLSAGLEAILAQAAPLAVFAGAVELPFGRKVQALRSAIAENPDLVRDVAARLREGFVLTSKGELKEPFAQRDAGLTAILDHYDHCDRLMHEIAGHRLHVVGGTFLGAARQGGAIDHDVDFDAAYLSGARDAAALKVEHLAVLTGLLRRGEDIRLVNPAGHIRRRHFKWRSNAPEHQGPDPVEIDVFPAFIDADDFYCRPTFVRIPGGADLILPLRRIRFGDRDVWAPNRIEEKAASVFGPSWRVSDPFWVKPKFAGQQEALAGLTLGDDDLIELAGDMRADQADALRAAIAAGRSVASEDCTGHEA